MKIGGFGVGSKTVVMKRFAHNRAFEEESGHGLSEISTAIRPVL